MSINLQTLVRAIRDFETSNQAASFLELVLTDNEQDTILNRLAILQLLNENKSYQEISDQLGVSPATIASVTKFSSKPDLQAALNLIQRDQDILKKISSQG